MALSLSQLQSLKTTINGDPALAGQPLTSDGAFAIAAALNVDASPAFWVYRRAIPSAEIGKKVNYVAVAAMTTANLQRVSDFLRLNISEFDGRDDVKTFLSDTFSGALGGQGQATRDALDLMLRRLATRFERIYATGTGSTAAPGTLVLEGPLSYQDVEQARALP
jgi:hypothetical protein